ncbi:hypothetical protein K474DRAFT_1702621 [Panus rudis PR-1116 ss-1]|nr:hypothetical protein K474DRAFT_1702621 [Panus rudis PR-1116 ss-1]
MPLRGTLPERPSETSIRQVNNLLHILRGEHFRHERNVRASQGRIPTTLSSNSPLPINQIFGLEARRASRRPRNGPFLSEDPEVEPEPPNDEVAALGLFDSGHRDNVQTLEWREFALSVLFSNVPLTLWQYSEEGEGRDVCSGRQQSRRVPSLVDLCLQVLLDHCRGPHFGELLVPYLPSHLRRRLLRWTAVHSPLPSSKLFTLCKPHGHIQGELIVVGPHASLPADYFRKDTTELVEQADPPLVAEADDDSWELEESSDDSPEPLVSLALVYTPLAPSTLFSLPPTLTHIALLSLPIPTPIHRLPRICPLLETLDLSYNRWLSHVEVVGGDVEGRVVSVHSGKADRSSESNEKLIDRVEWIRWRRLRVLGLRECGVGQDIIAKVNKGRWSDVQVIGVDGKAERG